MPHPPIVKVRNGWTLAFVGYSDRAAVRFHIREDALLTTLLDQGFATLGPYIFTLV